MTSEGRIASWNDPKGYGFITPNDGGKRVFIHISELSNRKCRPEINQPISYVLSKDKQGRPCATKALLPGDQKSRSSHRMTLTTAIVIAVLFMGVIGAGVAMGSLSMWVTAIILAANLVAALCYTLDKTAAQNDGLRISEGLLHLFGIAGGWPGGLIAQQKLRHKTRKQSFQVAFWITAAINLCILIFLMVK